MSERAAFHRKVAYGVVIILLVFPLVWLSTPATEVREGGWLSRLRKEYGISQANLGEVDPASETMRFLTLGLRNVAVTVLTRLADYYKMKEDWTSLSATLQQLMNLQPNYISFWKYQAWNLSYNVSVEFDDYHDRYYYVREGIEFLKRGEDKNRDNPLLLSDLGWFLGHKIGRADESEQYRRLFKADDDFHDVIHPPELPANLRDNWLFSKAWYNEAINAVDERGKSLSKKSPHQFYSDPAKSQMNYAEAIEGEGDFERARTAWITADEDWTAFGQRPIQHSFGDRLLLGNETVLEEKLAEQRAALDALGPTARQELLKERRESLTDPERKLADTPPEQVPTDQSQAWYSVQNKLTVTDREVADRIARDRPGTDAAKQALKLAHELEETSRILRFTQSYKEIVNFDYWQLRCDFEQTDNALEARRLMMEAHEARKGADFAKAEELYREGFAKWRMVIDEFPDILDDDVVVGDQLITHIKRFREVLEQTPGGSLDESFPLWDAVERFDQEGEFSEELAKHLARQNDDGAAETPAGDDGEL